MNFYGLLIGTAIYVGISKFQQKDTLVPKKNQDSFLIFTILFSVIGARLYHVFDYWSYYSQDPVQILNLPAGGLGIFGAIIFAFIYILYFCVRHKIHLLALLDEITPLLAFGQSIGRLGNYFNTEVFGIPTYIDLGQYIPPRFRPSQYNQYSYFHPIWLYESIAMMIIYHFIKNRKHPTANYLILYGIVRFFLEFLRFDTWQTDTIKVGQLLSLLMILTGSILIVVYKFKKL